MDKNKKIVTTVDRIVTSYIYALSSILLSIYCNLSSKYIIKPYKSTIMDLLIG